YKECTKPTIRLYLPAKRVMEKYTSCKCNRRERSTMPTLTLIYEGKPLAFTLEKFDRAKLYGYAETETLTTEGEVCSHATLCGDGHTIAGKGDTAIAYLSPDGFWRERSELRPVDARDGAAIVPVKPTFAYPVNLDETKECPVLGVTIRKAEASQDDYL